METVIYLTIFIIGTLLGSFFSLAIYRIPLKQDITHKRSYCPKCNHKLQFWDMIPILSYALLRGKCRYCKEKIRARYICLEIFSGILFLLFALSVNINIYEFDVQKLVYLVFGMFYISTLFIIAGIDKENNLISKPVLIFGLIVEVAYIIYLYVVNANIYKYVIYLFLMSIVLLINTILLKQNHKGNYIIQILNLCLYLFIATGEMSIISSIFLTLVVFTIKQITNKKNQIEKTDTEIPIGFYLCFTNIAVLILQNFVI